MQNKTKRPEKTISPSNLPSIITAVVLIVGIGTVYGLVGYLFSGIKESITPAIQVSENKSNLDKIEKPVVFEGEEDISDWKVYRNEKYGFEVKYPNNYILEKNSEESINFWTEDRYKLNSEIILSKGASRLSHNLGIEVANEKWSKEKIDENLKNNEVQKEEIYLNNIKIIKFLKKSDEGNIYLNCIQKNNIYIVIYKNDSTSEKEFNQILSTFKFIEEDETVNWQTYQNEEYGFEINYPENWYYNRDKQVEKKLDYNLHIRFIEDTKTSSQDTHYPDIHYPIEFMIWPDNIGISDSDPCDYEILEKKDEKQYILSTCDFKKYGKIMNKMAESFKFIEKDETENWKTYRNEEYGFELKYPGDWDNPLWQENEYRKGIIFGCPVFDFEGNKYCPLFLNISEVITKNEAIRNISVGAYKEGDVIINEGNIPTIKEFSVDTREAITYHGAGICVETYTKIFDGKMTISFTDRCSVYEGKIFDQILSTFKFIEEDETENWQTYRNEEYELEFKYPQDYMIIPNSYNSFMIELKSSKIHFEEVLGKLVSASIFINFDTEISHYKKYTDMETIYVNGVKSIKYRNIDYRGSTRTFIPFKNERHIEIHNLQDCYPKHNKVYDGILKTLKF